MECNYNWINVLSALLTPTIAIAGSVIAWLQYRTNSQKRKNDNCRPHDVEDLIPVAMEARMLFGKDIAQHIISLENKAHKGSPFFPDDDFIKPFMKYLQLK